MTAFLTTKVEGGAGHMDALLPLVHFIVLLYDPSYPWVRYHDSCFTNDEKET